MRSFLFGVRLPLRAAQLIVSHPRLILLSLLPVGVTLVIFVFGFSALHTLLEGTVLQQLAAWGWSMEGWAASFVLWTLRIFLLLAGSVSFSFAVNLVAVLFNDFLAESSEKWVFPPLPVAPKGSFTVASRIVLIDLAKNVVAGIGLVLAALLSWVPVLNFFAVCSTFLMITFQYISYAQTRRGVGIAEALLFVWHHLFACLGFGFVFSFLFFVPVLSIFVLPVAVVAGNLLVAEAQLPHLK